MAFIKSDMSLSHLLVQQLSPHFAQARQRSWQSNDLQARQGVSAHDPGDDNSTGGSTGGTSGNDAGRQWWVLGHSKRLRGQDGFSAQS